MERSHLATIAFLLLQSLFLFSNAAGVGAGVAPPTLAKQLLHVAAAGGGGDSGSAVQYETRYYTQRLDHFDAAPESYRTFRQRYLVNDTYWGGAAAPVFLYAGNEGDIELFASNTGFMWEAAPRFRALLLFIEHRYYGESMPFGSKAAAFSNASTLGYLTSTQAIADYVTLILHLKANLSASAAPVLVFGGSYGGMLAAWMRMKYPHIVVGAVASSAPILNFYGLASPYAFYNIVSNDFKSESEHCYDVIKNSWQELQDALSSVAGEAELKRTFNMCRGSDVKDIPGLLGNALVYVAMQDYPTPANFLTPLPAYPVREMCRAIDSPTSGNDTFSRLKDAMTVYYNYTGRVHCFGDSSGADPYGMYDGWDWQDIGNVLKRSGSNIIFFNGLRDPWSGGGVLKSISKSIIALVEPQGAHHVDLRFSTKEDPDWLKEVRRKEMRIMSQWLRQYYRDEGLASTI